MGYLHEADMPLDGLNVFSLRLNDTLLSWNSG